MNPQSMQARIEQLHRLYCRLTGQSLTLGFDRQRLWYELIRAGFTQEDLSCLIIYLQKQIRQGQRNVGALKLSNLLQLDRFEEDLNISRVRLTPKPQLQSKPPQPPLSCSPAQQEEGRRRALNALRDLQHKLRLNQI